MHPWVMLLIAGLLEVVWAGALPLTKGFTKAGPSALVITAMIASMWLLATATRSIPISVAYPIWVGIGAAGAYLAGVLILKEPVRPVQIVLLMVLLGAVVGLKLTTPKAATPVPSAGSTSSPAPAVPPATRP